MKRYNRRTLILNADYMPIHVKHWTEAMCLLVKEKAVQVDFYRDDEIKGAYGKVYAVPAVIALTKYVRRDYKRASFNKTNVFVRDRYTCQYCLGTFKQVDLTFDHVIARSKWKGTGTSTCWTNIVTACFGCNAKKADKSCDEVGMFPLNAPIQPSSDEIFVGLHFHGRVEKEWIKWLGVFPSFKELAEALEYEQTKLYSG